jgi:hypothetical protein
MAPKAAPDEAEARPERVIEISGHHYRLTARPLTGDEGSGWVARIAEYSLRAGAEVFRRPVIDSRSQLHDQAAIVVSLREVGPTADAALETLARRIMTAISEATRIDVAERSPAGG